MLLLVMQLSWNQGYSREIGKPFIRNYSSKTYNAHTQNWDAIQDKKGIMYFGNTYGVLQYDGVSWRLIRVANKSTVRSLGLGITGKVFVGAVDELGYLSSDELGELTYHSLLDNLDPSYHNFGNVWSVLVREDEVFFQTRNYIFRYKDKAFTTWEIKNSYHKAFLVAGNIYVRQEGVGLLELRGEDFQPLQNTASFANEVVSAVVAHGPNELLIGTRTNGLFIYDKSTHQLRPIFPQLKSLFKEAQIYAGLALENDHYAFATLMAGTIIINKEGEVSQELNIHSGIQNERVYNLFSDRDGALWLATDNGISHAEITIPLTDWDQSFGLKGTVYSILRHNGLLYAGTSNGVFALLENEEEGDNGGFRFVKVANIHAQSWHLISHTTKNGAKKLLVATSDGVYEITQAGGRFSGKLIAFGNTTTFFLQEHQPSSTTIYVGLSDGVGEIRYEQNAWKTLPQKEGISGVVRNMVFDLNDDLWVSTRHTGVYKITFNEKEEATSITNYTTEHGLPNNYLVNVCVIDSALLVVGPHGVVSYNRAKNHFESNDVLGKKYTTGHIGILHAIEDEWGNRWFHAVDEAESKEWLEVSLRRKGGSYQIDSVTLKRLSEVEMYAIYPEQNNITWIGGADGLVRYDNTIHIDADNPFHTLIRGVHTHEDEEIFLGEYPLSYTHSHGKIEGLLQDAPEKRVLDYRQNSVSFHYAAATYENETDNRYSHYLENYDPPGYWSHWKHETVNEYTNLPEGDYTFYVKARNIYDHESTIARFEFSVKAPWYRTILAYIVYMAVVGCIIWAIVAYNIRRLQKKNRLLELKVWDKTKQLQQQNREIEEKNTELAQQTEEIAAQRDHLMESFENIKVLSSIGKELTSTLSIDGLIDNTYDQLTRLFDMSVFGLGFVRQDNQTLEFPKAMAFGEQVPLISYDLNDRSQLAIECYQTQEEILIKNYQDYQKDNVGEQLLANKEICSAIYLPLTANEKRVGVISIQHQDESVFQDYHLNLLRNLATYIAIALDNAEAYSQIQDKNFEIQRASKEITDSINYAKRIQGAMLPRVEDIQAEFPDSFVFLKPKDIVSGDFYWYSSKRDIMGNNKHIIAAVDCTGHGVPGAFMSTIGMDLMDEIVNLMGISEADQILNYLHKLVRKSLRQKETKNHDGMDMAVCVIDRHRGKIEYAGAKNPLIFFKGGEMQEINGDRRSIGGSYWNDEHDERNFTKHIINIDPDEPITCYLYTDGFQDQFGGPKRRKYMSKRFKETLHQVHTESMEQQAGILEHKLEEWRADEAQVDDVLVIGFRI